MKFASEAEECTNKKAKAVYPKTPHPGSLKSPQLSSTPLKESSGTQHVQSPVLACSPRAISFNDCTQPGDMERHTEQVTNQAKGLPYVNIQEEKSKKKEESGMVSPGLPKDEDERADGDENFDDPGKDLGEKSE